MGLLLLSAFEVLMEENNCLGQTTINSQHVIKARKPLNFLPVLEALRPKSKEGHSLPINRKMFMFCTYAFTPFTCSFIYINTNVFLLFLFVHKIDKGRQYGIHIKFSISKNLTNETTNESHSLFENSRKILPCLFLDSLIFSSYRDTGH